MKVALIDPSLFTAPYDQQLARGLATVGCKVVLYSRPRHDYETWEAHDVEYQSAFYRVSSGLGQVPRFLTLPMKGVEHVLNMGKLAERLADEKPDLIHFQWCPLPLADQMLLAKFRQIAPVVLTVHDPRPFNGDPTAALQRLGYRKLLQRFDRLIVHTRLAFETLVRHGAAPDRIDIIPHGHLPVAGADTLQVADMAGGFQEAPQKQDRAVTFVLIGKIKPYKGVDTLIRAVSRMPEEVREKCRFVVAGKPYMNVSVLEDLCQERCVEHLFQFEFRYLDDSEMGLLIAGASALVFPYREIDASGVLMMALPFGRPIIASRLGMFETALQHGVHGYLVDPGDEHALASALTDMVNQGGLREEFGANVARLSQQQPSWRDIGQLTLESYRKALDDRAASAVTDRKAREFRDRAHTPS
jgi:glycosyltransferase involved in cell wall biosynthesis